MPSSDPLIAINNAIHETALLLRQHVQERFTGIHNAKIRIPLLLLAKALDQTGNELFNWRMRIKQKEQLDTMRLSEPGLTRKEGLYPFTVDTEES